MFKWVILFIPCCAAFKILVVFPVPGKSHSILGEGYVRHLLAAGHEVTYITPVISDKPVPNLRVVDVSDNFKTYALGDVLSVEKIMSKEVDMTNMQFVKQMFIDFANATTKNPNVKKLLEDANEKFDAVIVEWLYTEIYSGFALAFNCPLIWSSSLDPHALVLILIDEAPNPAYTADHMSDKHPPFTFWQRVNELWTLLYNKYSLSDNSQESQIYDEAFAPVAKNKGIEFVPLNEMIYKGSIMLGNSHVSFGQPIALPQNYKHILGYHIPETIAPLLGICIKHPPFPQNLQKIMDDAPQGVIYFSMGSMVKSKSFPSEFKKGLLELFRRLPQTIIWKFEENLPNLPRNVHIVEWAPQTSVLAHPNCVLFITHGGLLSTTEAIHFAVPLIGIPVFADQFLNMDRVVRKGFGRKVNLDVNFMENIKNAVVDMLANPSYRAKAEEVSFVYHHRPVSPGAELVHWVEHVVRTRGAPHLRSPALHMPFYQKYYMDLAALVAATLAVLATLSMSLFVRKKVDTKKKNK